MNYFIPFLILFLSACASLKPVSVQESLKPIRLEGEGRGRIGYSEQNYLFRFESAFKDHDWLLNLTIPMHGEETLVFENLDQKVSHGQMQSLELQIDKEIKKQTKLSELQNENIVAHLRSLVRFVQAEKLGLDVKCQGEKCLMEGEEFIITPISDGVRVKRYIDQSYFVEFSALYLDKTSYSRSNFFLKKEKNSLNYFSLELFWKNN